MVRKKDAKKSQGGTIIGINLEYLQKIEEDKKFSVKKCEKDLKALENLGKSLGVVENLIDGE